MVIKLKEGCLVELNNIKMAKVEDVAGIGVYNVVISYFDEKKNPKAYIHCDSEKDGHLLVDLLMDKIKDSKRIKIL